jgi:hypothetical protein
MVTLEAASQKFEHILYILKHLETNLVLKYIRFSQVFFVARLSILVATNGGTMMHLIPK